MDKVTFNIHYRTEYGQSLKIVGSCNQLGKNDLVAAPYMFHQGDGHWTLELKFSKKPKPFFYRYVVVDEQNGTCLNEKYYLDRIFTPNKDQKDTVIFDQWRLPFRGAGVAVPLFSVRTENGLGVGEFPDLKKLVDWAAVCNFKLIQLLPIQDTSINFTWTDSLPYAAISVFALHPIYLNIEQIGTLSKKRMKDYLALCKTLNALQQLDYEAVIKAKWEYIREIYKEEAEITQESKPYKDFLKKNAEWLKPYAVFCALRDTYKTCDFSQWDGFSKYSSKKIQAYIENNFDAVAIHYFVQFHLHTQLLEASEYAKSKGIRLKGDIPIGVYRHSVEIWMNPKFYNLDYQAGSPPDAFSEQGQCWGFPTYNWTEMGKTNYDWWCKRLKKMETYFQVFRIDHILGFFRIWEISADANDALLGYFSPALPFSIEELKQRGLDFDFNRFCKPYTNGNPSDVIFIEDRLQKNFYHPRIALHSTCSYQNLEAATKILLDSLHNDYFYHRHNEFWKEKAMKKLKSLKKATQMMACGEDLGMIPDCVPSVMKELEIISLCIQRMPNDLSKKFADLEHAPYLSVCSPSTHDISGIRGWWEENSNRTHDFFYTVLHQNTDCPKVCEPYIVQEIIKQHLHSPCIWAIFPIQDLLAMDGELRLKNHQKERINDPSNNRHCWNYRVHHPIEKLCTLHAFNTKISEMITSSARN